MHIRDRVVQKALCDYVLLPKVAPYLIYDNGASIKQKGIDFALDRLKHHLHSYNGCYKDNQGFIVLADFSKYFDNIPHEGALQILLDEIKDKRLRHLIIYLVSLFEIDLSIIPQQMADKFEHGIFNNLVYSAWVHENNPRKIHYRPKYMMKKSVGIGSQISQVIGVAYPTKMDNFFKIVQGKKWYGRYADDTYCICRTLEEAKQVIVDMKKNCDELGIYLNMAKTHIQPLNKPFHFLKTRFTLTQRGEVFTKVARSTVTRNNRRLTRLSKKLQRGQRTYLDGCVSYQCFKGRLEHCHNRKLLQKAQAKFFEQFVRVELDRMCNRVVMQDEGQKNYEIIFW